ncbi:hypothetical protein DCAR_0624672 [Daucus carota subsp. sativus]|uniref:Uncharacterized protein n=1 Tax=Daucus carota subsp. sativus TaxID=79200 RepID=A0A164VZ62_DAUCS|nr:PREDICTED: uncharacterized protein LOC108192990 [Daucus carota subsp. sativus]WOH05258.1 hypothetical protein DCAR_0624672 [Daucus carota subsp. sativus]
MQSLSSLFCDSPTTCSASVDKSNQISAHQLASENSNSAARFLLKDAFIKDDADQLVSKQQEHCNDDDAEDDFEFALASVLSPVPADQIFFNGQIRPLYPHFKMENNNVASHAMPRAARLPLRKLFVVERELDNSVSSCSSSLTDELEGVEGRTYCVWDSKTADDSPEYCYKSSHFMRRWKFRDFLQKSSSSGRNALLELRDINSLCNKLCR